MYLTDNGLSVVVIFKTRSDILIRRRSFGSMELLHSVAFVANIGAFICVATRENNDDSDWTASDISRATFKQACLRSNNETLASITFNASSNALK